MEEKITTIDEYISKERPEIQGILREMYGIIKSAAPDTEEKISWGMPTFVLHGNLVHFAAQKNHLGFHPAPSAIEAFSQEIEASFKFSKGAVQFPYSKPLPRELIEKMVRFRVDEQKKLFEEKEREKAEKKK